MVALDPDVAQVFPDSESVNQALRAVAGIIQHQSQKTHPQLFEIASAPNNSLTQRLPLKVSSKKLE